MNGFPEALHFFTTISLPVKPMVPQVYACRRQDNTCSEASMDSSVLKFHQLLEANRILFSTLKLPDILRRVTGLPPGVAEGATSSLLLSDDTKSELYFALAPGEQEPQFKKIRLSPGEGIAGTGREVVSRMMNRLKRMGCITYAKGYITVTSAEIMKSFV